MNTPAHILIGAACFGSRDKAKTRLTLGAMLGGVLPDLSLYLMAGVSLFILQIPAARVFNELYFSDAWQFVFSVDNSFIVWGLALVAAILRKNRFFMALCLAAFLHLISDFALHNDDARIHFWPLTDWRFFSPVSYWDSQHHAYIVAPLEGLLCAVAAVFLLSGKMPAWLKAVVIVLFIAEFFVIRSWLLFF